MPAPAVYAGGSLSMFPAEQALEDAPFRGVLFATDRQPAEPGIGQPGHDRFYTSSRGKLLRLGIAQIQLGKEKFSWEEAKRISMTGNRGAGYPLQVTSVDELGVLDRSFHPFASESAGVVPSAEPARRFSELVNGKLALSGQKDIFIFVHGYKVNFDNPVLVATELWHYLGYEGVFIAFCWPATENKWAYFGDAETTTLSAYQLRVLLEYLAETTQARRINVIGYSQGTRVVTQALHDLALKYSGEGGGTLARRLRIGQVVMIASDIEPAALGLYIHDGLLRIVDRLTIYLSSADRALSLSRMILGRARLGQMIDVRSMRPGTKEFLRGNPQITAINVTEAEAAAAENGHRYFRKSPWVSSDLLVGLRYDLSPADRGLVRMDDAPIWSFPPDYIERLRQAVASVDPAMMPGPR